MSERGTEEVIRRDRRGWKVGRGREEHYVLPRSLHSSRRDHDNRQDGTLGEHEPVLATGTLSLPWPLTIGKGETEGSWGVDHFTHVAPFLGLPKPGGYGRLEVCAPIVSRCVVYKGPCELVI